MPDKKAQAPPPGTYAKDSTLNPKGITMIGRYKEFPPKKSPPPGAYTLSFSQVHGQMKRTFMNTSENRSESETFKIPSWKTNAPPPGVYNPPKVLGPSLIS